MNTQPADLLADEWTMTLDEGDMEMAMAIGCRRNLENVMRGAGPGDGRDGWTRHIEGAAGEIAVAKKLGIYWNGNLGDRKASDVGKYEVRATFCKDSKLGLRTKDFNDKVYILVVGMMPHFHIAGWAYGRDANRQEWKWKAKSGKEVYFIPRSEMRPMGELPKL